MPCPHLLGLGGHGANGDLAFPWARVAAFYMLGLAMLYHLYSAFLVLSSPPFGWVGLPSGSGGNPQRGQGVVGDE